jgi:hypothetical protein
MDLTSSIYEGWDTYITSAAKPYMERAHLEDQAEDLRIILKWILQKYMSEQSK